MKTFKIEFEVEAENEYYDYLAEFVRDIAALDEYYRAVTITTTISVTPIRDLAVGAVLCPDCGVVVVDAFDALEQHQKDMHSLPVIALELSYGCLLCGLETPTSDKLLKHLAEVHSVDVDDEVGVSDMFVAWAHTPNAVFTESDVYKAVHHQACALAFEDSTDA